MTETCNEVRERRRVDWQDIEFTVLKDVFTQHSLSEGEQWMVCDEGDPHFVRAVLGPIKEVSE